MDNPTMTAIPEFIDGARVLATADIRGPTPTGRTRHEVDGRVIDGFAGLVVAQYDADPGVYLFYCDAEWNTVTGHLPRRVRRSPRPGQL